LSVYRALLNVYRALLSRYRMLKVYTVHLKRIRQPIKRNQSNNTFVPPDVLENSGVT